MPRPGCPPTRGSGSPPKCEDTCGRRLHLWAPASSGDHVTEFWPREWGGDVSLPPGHMPSHVLPPSLPSHPPAAGWTLHEQEMNFCCVQLPQGVGLSVTAASGVQGGRTTWPGSNSQQEGGPSPGLRPSGGPSPDDVPHLFAKHGPVIAVFVDHLHTIIT